MSPAGTSRSSSLLFNEGAAHDAAPSRFGAPSLADMPDDVRAVCDESRAKVGFVPNVFLAYAKRPEHFRAFMQYHDLLMKGPGGLSRAEREAIVVAVSAENRCLYCVTAHGAALRILGKDPIVADQIATNWRTADLGPRLRAMLTFASRVNEPGFAATDKELAELKAVGLGDDDIWDIAAIAAFFGFSNRMAGLMDMRPNPQFHDMGRAERTR
ncbi:MAG: peroxidase-related enzyme [Candidatus Eremiobacteraeota bacterium]|nr:peroxidase-related enzyme [Candidatus Eremiobacteraeota bacterium]